MVRYTVAKSVMARSSARHSSSLPSSGSSSLIGVSWLSASSRAAGAAERPPAGRSRSRTTRACSAFRLVHAVAEEVVRVGAGRERAREQHAVRRQRLGEFGGERRVARQLGEHRGEPASDGGRGPAFRPDQRQRLGEFGGERLGGVAVRGDRRARSVRRCGPGGRPTFSIVSGGALSRPTRSRSASNGVNRDHSALGLAADVSASSGSKGADAIGTTRPCTPSTASASGERCGATATTLQPRRYACSARRARPGSVPSVVVMSSRSTEPAQPGRLQRSAPAAGATPVDSRRVTGAEAPAERGDQIGHSGRRGAGARDQYGPGPALRFQLRDARLDGVPGRGADAGARLRRAAQQSTAVGPGEGVRCVEQRLVEHGGGPPAATWRFTGRARGGCPLCGAAGLVHQEDRDAVAHRVGQTAVLAGADQLGLCAEVASLSGAWQAGQARISRRPASSGMGIPSAWRRSGPRARSARRLGQVSLPPGWARCVPGEGSGFAAAAGAGPPAHGLHPAPPKGAGVAPAPRRPRPSAPYDRQDLVADLRHRLLVPRLDVQSQQGLGVGGAEVEPPVGGGDGQAVELVQGEAFLALVGGADRGRAGRPGPRPWS